MGPTPPIYRALAASEILRTVRTTAQGAEVHLVGGALRDSYLGFPSPDLDLVAAASRGRELSERLAELLGARLVLLGGDRFAAYRLVRPDLTLDIWDRQEASLLSDLKRRDFTINAIALDLADDTLHDPFHGMRDLESRTLRVVTDTSLSSDPLRVLRLVRFALLLPDFTVDPDTLELARSTAPLIPTVASERIRQELSSILARGQPTRALEMLLQVDLFPRLWRQGNGEAPLVGDLATTLESFEDAEEVCRSLVGVEPNRLLAVHALIMRKLRPTATDSRTRDNPLVTRSQARDISRLAAIDPTHFSIHPRRFLARWGELWLEAAAVGAALTPGLRARLGRSLSALHGLVETEGQRALDPQPLLDGQEIQDLLDLPPGREIGRLLQRLLDAQLRGKVTSRQAAVNFLLRSRTVR